MVKKGWHCQRSLREGDLYPYMGPGSLLDLGNLQGRGLCLHIKPNPNTNRQAASPRKDPAPTHMGTSLAKEAKRHFACIPPGSKAGASHRGHCTASPDGALQSSSGSFAFYTGHNIFPDFYRQAFLGLYSAIASNPEPPLAQIRHSFWSATSPTDPLG